MHRRLVPLTVSTLALGALLAGCVPAPHFDPRTGDGYEAVLAEFDAMSPEARLAAIAAGDASLERSLWAGGDLEAELGGPEAADDVFDGLFANVAEVAGAVGDDQTPYVLASFRSNVAEANGAGAFAGMVVSSLLADAGLAATKDGATGDAVHDFGGDGKGARATISSRADGTVSTTFEMNGEHKGVKIEIRVGTVINPCPDPTGVLEPTARYQVNVIGPNGAGSSTQIDVQMDIQLNDDAQIANSDYTYQATYMTRPQAPGSTVFDLTTRSVTFGRDEGGEFHTDDLSVAAFWDDEFMAEYAKVGEFFSRWVADSLETAAQKGWEDGRCIDLQITPSAGPRGLEPGAEVSVGAAPIAKVDGQPAGGTVTAQLSAGGASVTPSGTKVPADATFNYLAPGEPDESGTVTFESRSRRGVGRAEVTFDTKVAHYSITGGSGVFAGSGEWCAGATSFSTSGGPVTTVFSLSSADGGSLQYTGGTPSAGYVGGGTFTVEYRDGVPVGLSVAYAGQKYLPTGSVVSDSAAASFMLTPKETCDAR